MESKLIVIYKGNPMDSELVTEMLNDNGIKASLKNQYMGAIAPWHVTPGGFEPVEVEILEEDKEKALALIDEFNNSLD